MQQSERVSPTTNDVSFKQIKVGYLQRQTLRFCTNTGKGYKKNEVQNKQRLTI